jgi:hypothetical protein
MRQNVFQRNVPKADSSDQKRIAEIDNTTLSDAKQLGVALIFKLERERQIAGLFVVDRFDLSDEDLVKDFYIVAVVVEFEIGRFIDHVFHFDFHL